jgi:hypothetical protein
VVSESGTRYNHCLVTPIIKKNLKGVKESKWSEENEQSKESIIEVPAAGDTWYVQMHGFEALVGVF